MNAQYAEMITKFPLFAGTTVHGAQFMLERGEIREHEPGEVLFREGDAADFVLLLLIGNVQVFVERSGRTLVLGEAGPGTIVGELSVLSGTPRTACLRTSEKMVALHWAKESFRRMLLGNGFLSEKILGHSLRTLIEKERDLINALESHRDRDGVS